MTPTEPSSHEHTNRLIHEKSPYLQQHAHNPVDWYPWGAEALQRARAEDKPIFLSVGYSTCHWCHVMERESFEDPSIAAIMNEHFVCIKVDREERPDIDEIYMTAVQAMTGQGGWPLSAWLTPDLKPYYGGTYFPPDDRFGRPGFRRVLLSLSAAYTDRRSEVEDAAQRLSEAMEQMSVSSPGEGELSLGPVDATYGQLRRVFEPNHGGWGSAPKFPRSDYGSLCLRVFRRSGDAFALEMVTRTLDAMAAGGLYDHLGGGFHRYSTDGEWLAPHFEKMLYDNAQLAFHYLEAYQLTGRESYATVARETLEYVLRDMTHSQGGFFSAEDADSEGVEGKFYVWTQSEIESLLTGELRDVFVPAYDVTAAGNWEHHTILRRVTTSEALARELKLDPAEVESRLARARSILLEARGTRIRPHLDDKILTGWNGLMIRAFARAAVVLDEPRYLEAARRAADFVLQEMRTEAGLLRRWREGEARFLAYGEDYAMFVSGLLELYQAGFDLRTVEAARELHEEMVEVFIDPADGTLFNTRAGQDDLLIRVKSTYDGSVPTCNSVAAQNCITLYELTADPIYAEQARKILQGFTARLAESPTSLVSLVLALDSYLGERIELVIAGRRDDPATHEMRQKARAGYHPDLTLLLAPGDVEREQAEALMPSLKGKVQDGRTTAYVCRGFACRLPTTDAAAMADQLDLLRSTGESE